MHRTSSVTGFLAGWLLAVSVAYGADPPAPPSPGAAPDRGYTFPTLAAKTPASKNLTVLIHGANSTPAAWADGMLTAINGKLANANDWNLVSYNWQAEADASATFAVPAVSNMRNAQAHGQNLGKHILNQIGQGGGYEHIHFISHSLGGRVVESATIALMQGLANNNNDLGKMPVVHTTFLDAYTPLEWETVYGKYATWSEHYWSQDLLDTNDSHYHAANFNITAVDADPNRGGIFNSINDHQWPHEWYRRTVDNFNLATPNATQADQIAQDRGLGFPLSKEAGHAAWGVGGNKAPRPIHKVTTVPANKDAPLPPAVDVAEKKITHTKFKIAEINRSTTGTIAIPQPDDLTISAPADNGTAWINLKINVPDRWDNKINFFEFDFDFTSAANANGILAFHLNLLAGDTALERDNKRFFDLFEKFAVDPLKDGTRQASREIFFPAPLSKGMHTLAIRLDSAAIASSLSLFDLRLGSTLTAIPEPATLMLLIMAAGVLLLAGRHRNRNRT
jgi:hypothetical protein